MRFSQFGPKYLINIINFIISVLRSSGSEGKGMIQLLFVLLLAEVLAVAALLFRTPLRSLFFLGLDRLKRGRGPLVVRTVAATGLVLLGSSLNSMTKIRARSAAEEGGFLTPSDQVLLSLRLLETFLIGASLALP